MLRSSLLITIFLSVFVSVLSPLSVNGCCYETPPPEPVVPDSPVSAPENVASAGATSQPEESPDDMVRVDQRLLFLAEIDMLLDDNRPLAAVRALKDYIRRFPDDELLLSKMSEIYSELGLSPPALRPEEGRVYPEVQQLKNAEIVRRAQQLDGQTEPSINWLLTEIGIINLLQ